MSVKYQEIHDLYQSICIEQSGTIEIDCGANQGGIDVFVTSLVKGKRTNQSSADFFDFAEGFIIPYSVDIDAVGSAVTWTISKDELKIESSNNLEWDLDGLALLSEYLQENTLITLREFDSSNIFQAEANSVESIPLNKLAMKLEYEFDENINSGVQDEIKTGVIKVFENESRILNTLSVELDSIDDNFGISDSLIKIIQKPLPQVISSYK